MFRRLWNYLPNFRKGTPESETAKPIIELGYLRQLCGEDTSLQELLADMLGYFHKYAEMCLENSKPTAIEDDEDTTEREIKEKEKEAICQAMVDSVNILSRALAKAGKDSSWIEKLKSSEQNYARFAIAIIDSEKSPGNEQKTI